MFPLTIVILISSCQKDKISTLDKAYTKYTFVNKSEYSSSAFDSAIIELNYDSTMKSIKAYNFGPGNYVFIEVIQNFMYSPGSRVIDSSIIMVKHWIGGSETFVEKYAYSENKISKIFRPKDYSKSQREIIEFSFNQNDQITLINVTSISPLDTSNREVNVEYNKLNISSTYPGYNYYKYDGKINPIYQIYKQSNFPIYNSFIPITPMEYGFSENNSIIMGWDSYGLTINQSFKYNQFNYPVEIKSNWGNYNVKIYYE